MDGPNHPPRRYKWPWLVAAAVALGIVLAMVWMRIAVNKVERETNWNTPLSGSSSAH